MEFEPKSFSEWKVGLKRGLLRLPSLVFLTLLALYPTDIFAQVDKMTDFPDNVQSDAGWSGNTHMIRSNWFEAQITRHCGEAMEIDGMIIADPSEIYLDGTRIKVPPNQDIAFEITNGETGKGGIVHIGKVPNLKAKFYGAAGTTDGRQLILRDQDTQIFTASLAEMRNGQIKIGNPIAEITQERLCPQPSGPLNEDEIPG